MIKDIKALENYIVEMFKKDEIGIEDKEFLLQKTRSIKDHINDMEQKVVHAETKEKLGIEKQKTFSKSSTKVEEARHKNILAELKFMAENGIKQYNRSSYPLLSRHQYVKGKKEEQKNGAGKKKPKK